MIETQTSFGSKPLGYALTLLGALLWAIGGACGQLLFQRFDLSADWLVPIRLLIAGSILMAVALWRHGWHDVAHVFHNKKDGRDMVLFSLFGAGASQYTYYACIQYSNAAFATVISYMFPVFILLYSMMKTRRLPKLYEFISVLLVTAGAFVCTTHFELGALSVSPIALTFGILAALSSAYNTVKPQRLLRAYPLLAIMAWSMLLSGVMLTLFCRPWRFIPPADGSLVLCMAVIILGGTICAFSFFQAGVRIVGSLAGSILASVEPVGAVVIAVLFLGVSFTSEDFIGFVLILATIPIIALGQSREEKFAQSVASELLSPEDFPTP